MKGKCKLGIYSVAKCGHGILLSDEIVHKTPYVKETKEEPEDLLQQRLQGPSPPPVHRGARQALGTHLGLQQIRAPGDVCRNNRLSQ